jgi:hypothetical protein
MMTLPEAVAIAGQRTAAHCPGLPEAVSVLMFCAWLERARDQPAAADATLRAALEIWTPAGEPQ